MIRSLYTNKDLKKVPKYRKFMLYRAYNIGSLLVMYGFITVASITKMESTPIIGLLTLLGFSFVIYVIVAVHNHAFYGLNTPVKSFQEHIMEITNNNKGKNPVLAIFNTLFLTVLFFILISQNVITVAIYGLVTLIVQFLLIDLNDLGKIAKVAKKLDVEVEEYRLFDNDLFSSLTNEQVFYVYSKREELVAFCALTKDLDRATFQERLDREEYILVTMIAKQMEKLGK